MTHYRTCIHIAAKDSPNVAYALWEIEQGRKPSGRIVVPGVISWQTYCKNLATFDEQEVCQSLEAKWWKGQSLVLAPKAWIDLAVRFDATRPRDHAGRSRDNPRRCMGVDSAEGGDDSCIVVGGQCGIDDVISIKTPDTNKIPSMVLEAQGRWGVAWEDVVFDLGGGGKEHYDRFWANGRKVRGVRFGGAPQLELRRGMTYFQEKREQRAEQAAFVHCRDEMAWDIRMLLKPDENGKARFGIPANATTAELRRQLELVPYTTDGEGRMKLPPKTDPMDSKNPETLKYIIGRSPDQFDAFCLMVYGLTHRPPQQRAGVS